MSTMKYKIVAIMAAFSFLLIACNKETTPKPKEEEPLAEFNRDLLIGKWEAVSVVVENYNRQTLYDKQSWIKDSGYVTKDGKVIEPWTTDKISMLTFSSNNSFSHVKPDGNPDSYMLADIFPPNGNWYLGHDTLLLTTVFDTGNRDTAWGSYYTRADDGHYIIGLSKTLEVSPGSSLYTHIIVVIKKQ